MTKSDRPASVLEAEIKASLDRTLGKVPRMLEEMLSRAKVRREQHAQDMEEMRERIRRGTATTGSRFRL